MIDMHCHILPDIDDGAKDWAESIAMARYLEEQGVTAIVATPHYLEGYFTPEAKEILEKTAELQKKLIQEGITIKVYPGCETHISPDLPDLVQQKKVLTVNNGGKYLLVELPFHELPKYTEETLFRLKIAGVTPIIAHPERNEIFASNPVMLLDLVRKGYLTQLNAASLLGTYGRKPEKTAKELTRCRAVHFLGSDLHGLGSREIPVKFALETLTGIVDAEERCRILQTRPEEALTGGPVDPGVPGETVKESSLLKRIVDRLLG